MVIYMLVFLRDIIWGNGTLILIALCGAVMLIKSRFIAFRRIGEALTLPFSNNDKNGGLSPFAALATALGGTMGVGNIVGVGTAIGMGGAGAIFWMWLAALLGMGIKFAEINLAVKYKDDRSCGPMGYIKNGLRSRPVAAVYAVLCAVCSLGIGNCVQVGAVRECFGEILPFFPYALTLIVLVPFFFVILRGSNAVSRANEVIVPAISAIYILGCIGVILINANRLADAFRNIFASAFALNPILGGTAGAAISRCISVGVSQGVFSNEAGMGSSSIVHSLAENAAPHKQGLWGVFEVFFDTVVICSLSAFAVLCAPVDTASVSPQLLTYSAFESCYDKVGSVFIALCVSVFALATLLSWSFYGARALMHFNVKKRVVTAYRVVFVIVATVSVFMRFSTLYVIADILNGLMLLINVPVLILLCGKMDID